MITDSMKIPSFLFKKRKRQKINKEMKEKAAKELEKKQIYKKNRGKM